MYKFGVGNIILHASFSTSKQLQADELCTFAGSKTDPTWVLSIIEVPRVYRSTQLQLPGNQPPGIDLQVCSAPPQAAVEAHTWED